MVYHILADGTTVTDITGHIVKMEDAPAVYELMDSINRSGHKKQKEIHKAS